MKRLQWSVIALSTIVLLFGAPAQGSEDPSLTGVLSESDRLEILDELREMVALDAVDYSSQVAEEGSSAQCYEILIHFRPYVCYEANEKQLKWACVSPDRYWIECMTIWPPM